jgi:hypothetical protein
MSTPWCSSYFSLQAAQDGDGGFHAGLVHQHLLEAAFQGGVLFDVLAVLVQGGGADAVQLAPGQGGLEHVAGIDGALRLAGPHHGVQLVDEQDDAALVLAHFLEHGLQAFLELAPVLGASQQASHVQHQHALALEGFRYLAVDDALGQALDDGGLADAGLADQHRVVLGAPLQDLDGAADLVVAADHRVQLALAGAVGQVQGVLGQGLALAFGFLGVHALAAAHLADGGFQGLAAGAVLLEQAAGLALVVHRRQQEQLGGDVLVAPLGGFLVGQVEQVDQFLGGLDLAARAFHLGQPVHGVLQASHQGRQAGAGLLQDGPGRAAFLVDQGGQQVHRLDIGVVVAQGQALGVLDGGLERGGEFVETHVLLPIRMIASQMGKAARISTGRILGTPHSGPGKLLVFAIVIPLRPPSLPSTASFAQPAGFGGGEACSPNSRLRPPLAGEESAPSPSTGRVGVGRAVPSTMGMTLLSSKLAFFELHTDTYYLYHAD